MRIKSIGISLIICICIIVVTSCIEEITDPITVSVKNKLSNKDTLIVSGMSDWGTDNIDYDESITSTIQNGTIVDVQGKGDPDFIASHSFTEDGEVWVVQ